LTADLFFILSGFVIAHAYDPRFESGLSARAFIIVRALRFWPLFAVGIGIGGTWVIIENIVSSPAVLSITEICGLAVPSTGRCANTHSRRPVSAQRPGVVIVL
jgi:hypothetical protein